MPLRIRHVIIPGVNDGEDALIRLGKFIGSLGKLEKLEILPYHKLGLAKYDNLGIEYPLADTPAATKEDVKRATMLIEGGIQSV